MRRRSALLWLSGFAIAACAQTEGIDTSGLDVGGNSVVTGGAPPATSNTDEPQTGGSAATSSEPATGGKVATGGSASSGGNSSSGGGVSKGGGVATGGASQGGAMATGGAGNSSGVASGGASKGGNASSGSPGRGGAIGNGGAAQGGTPSDGGAATGGLATGGRVMMAGAPSTGGAVINTNVGGDSSSAGAGSGGSCLETLKTGCTLCADPNQGVATNCKAIIECWIANSCGPSDACSTGSGKCAPNTLKLDMAPYTPATATYTCACK